MPPRRALVVRLDHPPANAIGPELVAQVRAALERAGAAGRPVVMIGFGRFFSAGLDLTGLPTDREGMGTFVDGFEDLLLELFCFPGPTVAAVNGHAVAGGAILAAAADVRIGAEGNYRVGVSEVALGVVFPAAAFEVLRAAIPATRTAEVLLRGRLTGPSGAVENGFLHELTAPGDLAERAAARAEELAALPARAYEHTKQTLRSPFLRRAAARREECRRQFLDTWFSEEAVLRREALLRR